MPRPDRYYKFLSTCLSGTAQPHPEELIREINSPDWDWEHLVRIAAGEKVLPTLYGRMRELGVASQLPADISEFFCALEELSFERNQAILAELAAVGTLLNSIGIEPVLLKGSAYLLSGVYSDIASRLLADIDLLVPSAALLSVVDVLRRSGYEEDYRDPFPSLSHHHPMLRRSNGPGLELHHTLGLGVCPAILSATEMLSNSQPHEFRGARFRLPSPAHLVTHQIMHSQVHHHYSERIWPSLRTMYDLSLTASHFGDAINWSSVQDRFRQNRRSAIFTLHLSIIRDVLGTDVPGVAIKGALTRLRWHRRKALRSFPALRCLDPAYLFSSTVPWRVGRLRHMLKAPGGIRHALMTPLRRSFYQHLMQELKQLPGNQIFGNDG